MPLSAHTRGDIYILIRKARSLEGRVPSWRSEADLASVTLRLIILAVTPSANLYLGCSGHVCSPCKSWDGENYHGFRSHSVTPLHSTHWHHQRFTEKTHKNPGYLWTYSKRSHQHLSGTLFCTLQTKLSVITLQSCKFWSASLASAECKVPGSNSTKTRTTIVEVEVAVLRITVRSNQHRRIVMYISAPQSRQQQP